LTDGWISGDLGLGVRWMVEKSYGDDFKYISMASWINNHILSLVKIKSQKAGEYYEPQIREILS